MMQIRGAGKVVRHVRLGTVAPLLDRGQVGRSLLLPRQAQEDRRGVLPEEVQEVVLLQDQRRLKVMKAEAQQQQVLQQLQRR